MTESDKRSDLLARLHQHAETILRVEGACTDEAKTETYLVEPLLETLGYNSREPHEVNKRYSADVPGRKGEKVDYALMRDGEPVVIVEAKGVGNKLERSEIEQLQRYFPHTPARLAVLTDGIQWHWYKGRSERGQSHQMEASPFLTYNAKEPTESAAEWLTHITKDDFDPQALLRVSRRLEFTGSIRDWIHGWFVSDVPGSAQQVNKWLELGASRLEIQLVEDAMRSAWAQVLAGQQWNDQSDDSELEASGTGRGVSLPDTDHAGAVKGPIQSPSKSPCVSPSNPRIDADTYNDDFLDIGNGKRLVNTDKKRAWRVGGGEWNEEDSAAQLTTAVLGLLLRMDTRRHDERKLASVHSSFVHSDSRPEPKRWYAELPGFSNLYYNKNVGNTAKVDLLKSVAERLQLDPTVENPFGNNPVIEVWLVKGRSTRG